MQVSHSLNHKLPRELVRYAPLGFYDHFMMTGHFYSRDNEQDSEKQLQKWILRQIMPLYDSFLASQKHAVD